MATTRELEAALKDSPELKAAVDLAENRETLALEREPDDETESGQSYQCPDIVWQGAWKDVADILGIYDWRVWIAVTAAISARAHRNIHINYHGHLYGMGAYLLVAPSGVGKSLVPTVCDLLLPRDYSRFDSVESGQALAESLAEISRDPKGKILHVCSFPAILITSEWSQLLKTLDFHGSSLMERMHKAIDGERSINLNRADKHGNGKIKIDKPTLIVLGTTTVDVYADIVKDKHVNSGFMNRHFILPCEDRPWRYNDPNPVLDFDGVEAYGMGLPTGHTFALGRSVTECYSTEAYEYDDAFGRSFLEPLRNQKQPRKMRDLFGRLHVYHRRISALYAWASGSEWIRLAHVQAAEAAVRTSYRFLTELHGGQVIEMPQFMKARGDLEEKIWEWVRTHTDVTRRELCISLHKNGGYTAISETVDRLIEAKILTSVQGSGTGRRSDRVTLRIHQQ